MSHDNAIPTSSSHLGKSGLAGGSASASGSAPSPCVEQQRRTLQGQVEALRQVGALPSASAAGQMASAVQWNNWSNG